MEIKYLPATRWNACKAVDELHTCSFQWHPKGHSVVVSGVTKQPQSSRTFTQRWLAYIVPSRYSSAILHPVRLGINVHRRAQAIHSFFRKVVWWVIAQPVRCDLFVTLHSENGDRSVSSLQRTSRTKVISIPWWSKSFPLNVVWCGSTGVLFKCAVSSNSVYTEKHCVTSLCNYSPAQTIPGPTWSKWELWSYVRGFQHWWVDRQKWEFQ